MLLDIHVPRYGPEWVDFLGSGPVYSRIEAGPTSTFSLPAAPLG